MNKRRTDHCQRASRQTHRDGARGRARPRLRRASVAGRRSHRKHGHAPPIAGHAPTTVSAWKCRVKLQIEASREGRCDRHRPIPNCPTHARCPFTLSGIATRAHERSFAKFLTYKTIESAHWSIAQSVSTICGALNLWEKSDPWWAKNPWQELHRNSPTDSGPGRYLSTSIQRIAIPRDPPQSVSSICGAPNLREIRWFIRLSQSHSRSSPRREQSRTRLDAPTTRIFRFSNQRWSQRPAPVVIRSLLK